MTKIGLLSDTHTYLHPKIFEFFKDCHQIWHAGDIGNLSTATQLNEFKPLTAVYGNIDDHVLRSIYPENQLFICEEVKVYMTHIGGYPGKYSFQVKQRIQQEKPDLFISGHSHILKVMYDQKNNLLHMNPGAAGKSGFHQIITLLRFQIEGKNIKDLEIMELDK
ncbi:MAG: metallophosphoesterase family protein [Bacteroidota bacterium]